MATSSVRVRRAERMPIRRRSRAPKADGTFDDGWRAEVPATSQAVLRPASGARPLGLAGAIGLGLSLVAVLTVLFGAYLYGWSNLQASREQQRLLSNYLLSGELPAFHGHTPADGTMAGVLAIPALGLREALVEGTTSSDLEAGPGIMPATAVPGSYGNAVIAGRRGTFGGVFARLSALRPGEAITVVDYEGRFHFVVTGVRTLTPGQGVRVVPTKRALLTLVTSRSSLPPSGYVVVEARLVGTPATPAASTRPVTHSELALGGDSAALLPLAGWGLALVATLVASVVAYRRTPYLLLVYVLSTPVVLVSALFTFENLARLLPATM